MDRCIFLDRDGTLVEPRHYPRRPQDLVLYPGVASELRALVAQGFRLVVVTNQSGIARGLLTEHDLEEMHADLRRRLAAAGVQIDAFYHCPHHAEGVIPRFSVPCDCRKPEPGMLLRAARDLDLDLSHSWLVGDILDDVEAGNRAGCRTILVDLGTEGEPDSTARRPDHVARDTLHALRLIRVAQAMSAPSDGAAREGALIAW
jgi:D-glycero-D-manno-heptose 1,7-bisphosphate phosphatase